MNNIIKTKQRERQTQIDQPTWIHIKVAKSEKDILKQAAKINRRTYRHFVMIAALDTAKGLILKTQQENKQ